MTQDEIVEMARQAGFSLGHNVTEEYANKLEAFAKLVAAKEREGLVRIIEANILDEREECALTAENCKNIYHDTPAHIAMLIRARGE